jgi:hypothetical protein
MTARDGVRLDRGEGLDRPSGGSEWELLKFFDENKAYIPNLISTHISSNL